MIEQRMGIVLSGAAWNINWGGLSLVPMSPGEVTAFPALPLVIGGLGSKALLQL